MSPPPVFLDSVGLLAIWNADDQWHAAARPVFDRLVQSRSRMMTTSLVLAECGNAAARRTIRADVVAMRDNLKRFNRLIEPTPDDVEAAWTAYARGEAAQAGIVDHVSFVVMRRLGLTRAFTHDAHFRAAGFETLF